MLTLRLMDAEELDGDRHPERCVELAVPRRTEGAITVRTLRLTPADLVRLRVEADAALAEIRTAAMQAEAAWTQTLDRWHEDGRAAVASRTPDVGLLQRVLEALRRPELAPT
jgi:hypothetical protein